VVRHVVVGDLRVQQIERKGGQRSWTIVFLYWLPEGKRAAFELTIELSHGRRRPDLESDSEAKGEQ